MSLVTVAGSWVFSASTSTMPAVNLNAPAVGDLNLLLVAFKQTGATFTVPTGWTVLVAKTSSTNGAGYGAGTGDVSVLVLGRVFVSGDVAPTLAVLTGGSTTTASGNVVGVNCRIITATSKLYDIAVATDNRTSASSPWNFTATLGAAANIGTGIASTASTSTAAGDHLLDFEAPMVSTATWSSMSFVQTSATIAAANNAPVATGSTVGADLGVNTFWSLVTTGGTGDISVLSTPSLGAYGMQTLIRIREGAAPVRRPRNVYLPNPAISPTLIR